VTRRAIIPRERFKGRPGPKVQPNPAREYATLGAPPKDQGAIYEWALEVLSTSLYHVINEQAVDPEAERVRRREIRETTRAMATIEPKSRIFEAEARIRGDRQVLEDEGGPEMEDNDASDVAPEPYRAEAKRGRPRK
jgi:hypothetical protein